MKEKNKSLHRLVNSLQCLHLQTKNAFSHNFTYEIQNMHIMDNS